MPFGLIKRFASDRLEDIGNLKDAISNEVKYRAKQLNNGVSKLQTAAGDVQTAAGDIIGGPVQAFTKAGVNPLAAVTQNKQELNRAFNHYKKHPEQLNELGLKSNMMMRYYTGVGSKGLKLPEGTLP